MHSWTPHRLVYSKIYVDMENLFLFWFCLCDLFIKKKTRHVTRDRFTVKKILHRTVFNSPDPFTYYDWTLAPCGFLRLSVFSLYALNYFLPTPSHSMCDRASLILSKRESTFSVNQSRLTWPACLYFWRTDCKDKAKIKRNFHINIHFWIYQTMGGSIVHPLVFRSI